MLQLSPVTQPSGTKMILTQCSAPFQIAETLKHYYFSLEDKKGFCLDMLSSWSFSYMLCVKIVGCGMILHTVKTVRRFRNPCIFIV